MSFVWITEKDRREIERQQKQPAKSIAYFVRNVILRGHHDQ